MHWSTISSHLAIVLQDICHVLVVFWCPSLPVHLTPLPLGHVQLFHPLVLHARNTLLGQIFLW